MYNLIKKTYAICVLIIIYFNLISNSHSEDSLQDYYYAYIFVKNCHDLDPFFYVNNKNFELAKQSIKNIENDYKKKNNSIDTDVEWDKAAIKWKEDFESIFTLYKSLDTYIEDMAGMCKLYLMMLNAVGSSLENRNIEKDF